ncbi:MAG TPA: L-rhamnose mutarotase [Hanamia sp.]|nr:L-rhamnose mutarotase [Hanamia sp.]
MRYCLALDLKDDKQLIAEYEEYHQKVWPEIIASIKDAGIRDMEIYRVANRLFMIMETHEDFSFEKKNAMDNANPRVQEWEEIMWKYQRALPVARPGEKWILMKKIFDLNVTQGNQAIGKRQEAT